jgi:hypothetical protein
MRAMIVTLNAVASDNKPWNPQYGPQQEPRLLNISITTSSAGTATMAACAVAPVSLWPGVDLQLEVASAGQFAVVRPSAEVDFVTNSERPSFTHVFADLQFAAPVSTASSYPYVIWHHRSGPPPAQNDDGVWGRSSSPHCSTIALWQQPPSIEFR